MKCVVTGGAGFIGSNLVDRLIAIGHDVLCIDNFSTGQHEFLEKAHTSSHFTLKGMNLHEEELLKSTFQEFGPEVVFHLAANADVRFGFDNPRRDLEENTIVTYNVLEAMRASDCHDILFSSTGSVYGEAKVIPTPEDAPFPLQTSLYGASKLACEGMIAAYCQGHKFKSSIFRFVSILGERYTHGHVFDFYKKLLKDPKNMEVLGDGHQKKSYLYIHDCIDAIFTCWDNMKNLEGAHIYNLGTDEFCEVNESIKIITEKLDANPTLHYTGGSRGWIGDNPYIYLDCQKVRSLGWAPKFTIHEGIKKTLEYLQKNQHILNQRD